MMVLQKYVSEIYLLGQPNYRIWLQFIRELGQKWHWNQFFDIIRSPSSLIDLIVEVDKDKSYCAIKQLKWDIILLCNPGTAWMQNKCRLISSKVSDGCNDGYMVV